MKQNPGLTIPQKTLIRLMKELKMKPDKKMPVMKGGANIVDYISKQKKKKLEKQHRDLLVKELNKFIRNAKKQQTGGGIIQDWFSGKKAKKFWSNVAKGFKMVWKPGMKVLEPIANILAPEVGIPLSIANKTLGLT